VLHWLLVLSRFFAIVAGLLHRQMLNRSASSLSTSLSHFILDLLLSRDQVIIHLGHLLTSICNTCPYHFRCCFPFFPKLFVLLLFFSNYLISYFKYSGCSCSSSQKINFFTYFCNPLCRFDNRNLKCISPLCKIFVSLYLMKYLLQSRLFNVLVAFLACSVLFNTSLHFPEFVQMDAKYLNATHTTFNFNVIF
jgi:hypothetical protein